MACNLTNHAGAKVKAVQSLKSIVDETVISHLFPAILVTSTTTGANLYHSAWLSNEKVIQYLHLNVPHGTPTLSCPVLDLQVSTTTPADNDLKTGSAFKVTLV